jgi:hypothetical protein
MVDNARRLSHHEFRITVRRWEMLADMDGAHRSAQQAHEGRTAGIAEVGEEIMVHARGGLAQGAVMTEIFERAAATAPNATSAVPLVNFVLDVPTLKTYLDGTGESAVPADPRQRRSETTADTPVPPSDIVAAMMWGQVRRVVVDSAGVVINMGAANACSEATPERRCCCNRAAVCSPGVRRRSDAAKPTTSPNGTTTDSPTAPTAPPSAGVTTD